MRRALTRGGACLCACVGAVVLVVGGAASPAAAHAELIETQPAAGALLDTAPEQVVLRYSEPVDPFDDAVEVFDSSGDQVDTGDPGHVDGKPELVGVDLPALDDGAYVVTWRVASEDSHPIRGAFTFRVGAAGDTAGAEAEALMDRLVAAEGGDTTVGTLFGAVRFAGFVGLVVLVGGAFFLALLWPAGLDDRRARRLVGFGWVAAVVATVLSFGFQAAYSEGADIGGIVDSGPVGDVLGTRPGRVWLVRLALLAVLAVVAIAWRGGGGRRRAGVAPSARSVRPGTVAAVVGVGLALLATISLAGHAGAGDLVALAFVTDIVHLGSVAFWLGGLAMLFFALIRGDAAGLAVAAGRETSTVGAAGVDTEVEASVAAETRAGASAVTVSVVDRFSTFAFVAVIAIVASGSVQAWRQLRGFDALFDTTYGRVLIVKVLLFTTMIVAAAVSRSWVRRRQAWASGADDDTGGDGDTTTVAAAAGPPTLRALRLSVGVEVAVAALVLAATALLVNTVPGKDAVSPTFSTELHGAAVLLEVEVDPAKAGLIDVRLVTKTHGGEPLEAVDVSAGLALPSRDLPPIPLELESQGAGVYVAEDADIPFPGRWTLSVDVRVNEFDQDSLTTEIPVK